MQEPHQMHQTGHHSWLSDPPKIAAILLLVSVFLLLIVLNGAEQVHATTSNLESNLQQRIDSLVVSGVGRTLPIRQAPSDFGSPNPYQGGYPQYQGVQEFSKQASNQYAPAYTYSYPNAYMVPIRNYVGTRMKMIVRQ